jgi:hypothetical protein
MMLPADDALPGHLMLPGSAVVRHCTALRQVATKLARRRQSASSQRR